MKYRLFIPKGHADGTARYPLTVFLHGSGECGDDSASRLIRSGPDDTWTPRGLVKP